MVNSHAKSVPVAAQPVYSAIIDLINPVCQQHLNEEYAVLSRRLAVALARKRPSPLLRGYLDIWACAIVYVIGSVNFLFDRSQKPHMSADTLCAAFGVGQSSASNKAKLIRDMFGIYPLDPRWCLPGRMEENPFVWMLDAGG